MLISALRPTQLENVATLAIAAGALTLAVMLSWWLARARGIDARGPALRVIAIGLVFARLGFVGQHLAAYAAAPLAFVDLTDGGWDLPFGLAAACFALLLAGQRAPQLRKSLWLGFIAGGGIWLAGDIALLMRPTPPIQIAQTDLAQLDGAAALLAQAAGKPLVVNLWASWCSPCRREMPRLQSVRRSHAELAVLFVNQGETLAAVQDYRASLAAPLGPVLLDRFSKSSRQFSAGALPATLFFDRDGVLIDVQIGALSDAVLERALQRISRPHLSYRKTACANGRCFAH